MTTTLNITGHLEALIRAEFVRVSEETITASPANTKQVSEILRFANENNLTVTPTGGSTKQSWGNEVQPNPTKTNIRLELTRLNRVIEHPWQDLTCTVQAGCTWQQLQQALAKHGQFVALDPLWPERATVGGILATNDSGALRHRYGSLRDLVIGMTLVLADGTIARSGGKVVKNVAGYDLCKLVTGSFGTLAVITEATFRLHPLPQHVQTFTISAPQAAQLAPLMQSIRASHLLTHALQLRGDTNGFHLDIQLNAHPEAHQDAILTEMSTSQGLVASKAGEEVWQAREQLFETSEKNLLLKVTVPPIGVAEIAHDFTELQGNTVIQSLGIAYASVPLAGADINAVFAQIEVLSVSADCNSGNLLLLCAPDGYTGELQHRLEKHIGTVSPAVRTLMQAVKHQFDPKRTLSPGRFLGGI
jgi:glycolate oxidase FAD binding subunit